MPIRLCCRWGLAEAGGGSILVFLRPGVLSRRLSNPPRIQAGTQKTGRKTGQIPLGLGTSALRPWTSCEMPPSSRRRSLLCFPVAWRAEPGAVQSPIRQVIALADNQSGPGHFRRWPRRGQRRFATRPSISRRGATCCDQNAAPFSVRASLAPMPPPSPPQVPGLWSQVLVSSL